MILKEISEIKKKVAFRIQYPYILPFRLSSKEMLKTVQQ